MGKTKKLDQMADVTELSRMVPGGAGEITARGRKGPFARHMMRNWQIYAMMVLPLLYYVIFRYLPMAGNIIAFRKYHSGGSIFGIEWSGLKYFKQFINDKGFWRAFSNTITLNLSYLIFRFPLTLIFALLLNEIRHLRWKKFVQTVTYLPHFISMVIITGMILQLTSANGPINNIIAGLGMKKIEFMFEVNWFPPIFVISGLWQNLGWGTILYLAAISHINPNLYEAAEVDGANHFRRVLHVTIPGILPTITTLLILDFGGLVGSGAAFEKVWLLQNATIYASSDIVSTYLLRMFFRMSNGSYATAVGLFEGVINLILLSIANISSKKITGSSLW